MSLVLQLPCGPIQFASPGLFGTKIARVGERPITKFTDDAPFLDLVSVGDFKAEDCLAFTKNRVALSPIYDTRVFNGESAFKDMAISHFIGTQLKAVFKDTLCKATYMKVTLDDLQSKWDLAAI